MLRLLNQRWNLARHHIGIDKSPKLRRVVARSHVDEAILIRYNTVMAVVAKDHKAGTVLLISLP